MKDIERTNHLENKMYQNPKMSRQIMTLKQVRETLAFTENFIMACGHAWKLKVKNIGAGMKEVRLVPFDY